jgi:Domain of Unknown Function (DUF1080)
MEESMRPWSLSCVVVSLTLAAFVCFPRADFARETQPDRIAALIKQLGDDEFARREAASKELETIGQPALDALGKAAANNPDLEVRSRAGDLVTRIVDRFDRTDVQSVPPPQGAIVLFDGKNFDNWIARDGQFRPAWKLLAGGSMEAHESDIRTRRTFAGPYKLHVEFRVPSMTFTPTTGRGNSGVYVHGRYEVQILDSHRLKADIRSCGAIYGVAAPRCNACKALDVWQSFDIEFEPPQYEAGTKVRYPRLTVWHNGIKIHDQFEVPVDDTGQGLPGDPAQPGPIMLQEHGSPVQFRNIWLMPLANAKGRRTARGAGFQPARVVRHVGNLPHGLPGSSKAPRCRTVTPAYNRSSAGDPVSGKAGPARPRGAR